MCVCVCKSLTFAESTAKAASGVKVVVSGLEGRRSNWIRGSFEKEMRVRGDLHTNTVHSAGVWWPLSSLARRPAGSSFLGFVRTGGVLPENMKKIFSNFSCQARKSSTQKPVSTQMEAPAQKTETASEVKS